MATEDEINAVYEEYLNEKSDVEIVDKLARLFQLHGYAKKPPAFTNLEDYEREHLIRVIVNIDYTGRYDSNFEDLRKVISTNDSCG